MRREMPVPAPPALRIRRRTVRSDPALAREARGARKVVVAQARPESETALQEVDWLPPAEGAACPVLEALDLEIAIFNEGAIQDRHYHVRGTEIYTVLEGRLRIEVEGAIHFLEAGDTLVVRPGAIHEVRRDADAFLCQVVTAQCGGPADKIVVDHPSAGTRTR